MNSYFSGTPALTSRGFVEEDFVKVAEFFDASVKLVLKIKANTQGDLIAYFYYLIILYEYMFNAHQ